VSNKDNHIYIYIYIDIKLGFGFQRLERHWGDMDHEKKKLSLEEI